MGILKQLKLSDSQPPHSMGQKHILPTSAADGDFLTNSPQKAPVNRAALWRQFYGQNAHLGEAKPHRKASNESTGDDSDYNSWEGQRSEGMFNSVSEPSGGILGSSKSVNKAALWREKYGGDLETAYVFGNPEKVSLK